MDHLFRGYSFSTKRKAWEVLKNLRKDDEDEVTIDELTFDVLPRPKQDFLPGSMCTHCVLHKICFKSDVKGQITFESSDLLYHPLICVIQN